MVGRFKSEESMSTQPSMPTSIPIKEARTLGQEGKVPRNRCETLPLLSQPGSDPRYSILGTYTSVTSQSIEHLIVVGGSRPRLRGSAIMYDVLVFLPAYRPVAMYPAMRVSAKTPCPSWLDLFFRV